jgi:hypothetical protein
MRLTLVLLLSLLLAVPALAQELPAFRSDLYNPRSPEGIFDVLVHVDGEAILYIQDTNIRYMLLSGAPLRDAGSNYRQPLPRAVFGSFNMEKKAGRGSVDLVEAPSPVNNYTAVVRINDRNAGADFYHLRLDWTWNPANPSRPPGGRFSRPLDSSINDPNDYKRSRSGSFEFQGRVDDVAILYIRSDQVREEDIAGRPIRSERFEFSQPLPSVRLRSIELTEVSGRGRVELVEKPWEGSRFTAVVRISDPASGNGRYSFKLVWSR